MIYEKVGKFCLSNIRPFFFYFLLLVPILCAIMYLFLEYSNIAELEEKFSTTCKKSKSALEIAKKSEFLSQRYANKTPYFLEEQIESLLFLQEEQKRLEELLNHPALADKKPIESRLQFLQSANHLAFTEEAIRTSSSMKEVEERQKYPVQMSEEDLKEILSLAEDLKIDSFLPPDFRPQIVITDFEMRKKKTPIKTHVFEVDMQFIKREFIP